MFNVYKYARFKLNVRQVETGEIVYKKDTTGSNKYRYPVFHEDENLYHIGIEADNLEAECRCRLKKVFEGSMFDISEES